MLIARQSAWSVRLRLQAALRPRVVKMTFLWQGLLEFVRDRLLVQETKEAVTVTGHTVEAQKKAA